MMDNSKYMKQNIKLQSTNCKTRTIGVNTEEYFPKFNCHMAEDFCQRVILVPCLPYYYPTCPNNSNNNCCSPNFNINPNILNQYQFVRSRNDDMKHFNKCEKHSSMNLLHCCSSSNCTACTNCTSTTCANNQKAMNVIEVTQKPSNIPVKKNSRENGLRKSSQDKIESSYYEKANENVKQYCDEEMTRYATELIENQNYKLNQEYEQTKTVNDEKQRMNHLLTPTRSKFSNAITNGVEDSDECLEESENEDETSSIEELQIKGDEEERKVQNIRNNFNPLNKNFSKRNNGGNSDLEMLMMLKAFVNQNGDKDVNPKLNQLINHLSSQDSSLRLDSQIDNKKTILSRK